MLRKKSKKALDDSARVSVIKEMAKPRVAKSAKIAERRLDIARILERS